MNYINNLKWFLYKINNKINKLIFLFFKNLFFKLPIFLINVQLFVPLYPSIKNNFFFNKRIFFFFKQFFFFYFFENFNLSKLFNLYLLNKYKLNNLDKLKFLSYNNIFNHKYIYSWLKLYNYNLSLFKLNNKVNFIMIDYVFFFLKNFSKQNYNFVLKQNYNFVLKILFIYNYDRIIKYNFFKKTRYTKKILNINLKIRCFFKKCKFLYFLLDFKNKYICVDQTNKSNYWNNIIYIYYYITYYNYNNILFVKKPSFFYKYYNNFNFFKNIEFFYNNIFINHNYSIYNNFFPLIIFSKNYFTTFNSTVKGSKIIFLKNNFFNIFFLNYFEFFFKKRIFLKKNSHVFKKDNKHDLINHITYFCKSSHEFKFHKLWIIKMIIYSFELKDLNLLKQLITNLLEDTELRYHKRFLTFFKNLIIDFSLLYLSNLRIKGFFFDIRGKVGVAGNSKKRHFFFKIGSLNKTSKNVKIDYQQGVVQTSTGCLGICMILSF